MKRILSILLCVVALFATSCEKSLNEEEPKDTIELSTSHLELSCEGGTHSITVTSSCAWIAISEVEWITVAPAEGVAGQETLTLTIEGNASTESRSTVIAIKSNDLKVSTELHVLQSAFTLGTPPDTEIWYTANGSMSITLLDDTAFDATIISHTYENGRGVIAFDAPVTVIGTEAFKGCNKVDNFALPSCVQRIGDRAFYDCNALECISLGASLSACGENAFEGCFNLTTVHVSDLAAWCAIDFDGMRSNPIYFACLICINGLPVRDLTIPEGVASIGQYAFANLVTASSVSLPTTLERVGESAFADCWSLSVVNVKDVEKWCSVEFENLYSNPLYYGERLMVNGSEFTALKIESEVAAIKQYAFVNCVSLTSVELSKSVKTIEKAAFMGCGSIERANLGLGVTTIGDEAFRNTTSMDEVVIGELVYQIGQCAFMGCSQLKAIYCKALMPPVLADSYTFAYGAGSRRFYVPAGTESDYKMDEMWSQYADDIYPYNI